MNYRAVNTGGEFKLLPLPALTPTPFNTHTFPYSTNPFIFSALWSWPLPSQKQIKHPGRHVSMFMMVSNPLPYAELLTGEVRDHIAFAYYIEKMTLCTCLKRITDMSLKKWLVFNSYSLSKTDFLNCSIKTKKKKKEFKRHSWKIHQL